MYDYLKPIDDGLLMRPSGLWATDKLDYLRRYIEAFETAMRTHWAVRNFLDLMAGPGKNRIRDTKQIILGSPLLSLTTKYPFTGYFFIDFDPANTSALEERCKASPSLGNVHLKTGDCNILVNDVVKELKLNEHKSLNLAFLDPEGLELRWSTVAQLVNIRRMDMIINYPQSGLTRMMTNVYQSVDENVIDLFFGTREWRKIYAGYLARRTFSIHRELIDLYKAQLHQLGYQEDDILDFEPLMRNTKRNAPAVSSDICQ